MDGFRALLAVLALSLLPPLQAAPLAVDAGPQNVDFALLAPNTIGDGVWRREVWALEAIFKRFGWTYRELDFDDLNGGALVSGSPRYRVFVEPGGYTIPRDRLTTADGYRAIRQFVRSGGGYVGFCAGAYEAASTLRWAWHASGSRSSLVEADYQSWSEPLALFPGAAVGPFSWAPFSTSEGAQPVRVNSSNPVMRAAGAPAETFMYYHGGPFFRGTEGVPGLEVWATAEAPADAAPASRIGDGMPTIVRFPYGSGTVILFAYHPSIALGGAYKSADDESLNILHAALQVASGSAAVGLAPLDR